MSTEFIGQKVLVPPRHPMRMGALAMIREWPKPSPAGPQLRDTAVGLGPGLLRQAKVFLTGPNNPFQISEAKLMPRIEGTGWVSLLCSLPWPHQLKTEMPALSYPVAPGAGPQTPLQLRPDPSAAIQQHWPSDQKRGRVGSFPRGLILKGPLSSFYY